MSVSNISVSSFSYSTSRKSCPDNKDLGRLGAESRSSPILMHLLCRCMDPWICCHGHLGQHARVWVPLLVYALRKWPWIYLISPYRHSPASCVSAKWLLAWITKFVILCQLPSDCYFWGWYVVCWRCCDYSYAYGYLLVLFIMMSIKGYMAREFSL